jgi:hypothetical protein
LDKEEFLRTEADLITLVGTLGDSTPEGVVLKIAYAKTVLPQLVGGSPIPWNRVLDILEDFKLCLSEREAREILITSGLAEEKDGNLQIPEVIPTPRGFHASRELVPFEMPTARFTKLLAHGSKSSERLPSTINLNNCLAAIDRTTLWGMEIIPKVRATQLPGIPVFWTCENGAHEPFSPDPGTLTTSDTFLLIVERIRHRAALPKLDPDHLDAVLWLWERILALQRRDEGWNEGAFSVPNWDDDFVGSYVDEYREQGPCPTVDATGNAIIALSAAMQSGLARMRGSTERSILEHRTREAIVLGIRFLLRCQTGEGAWSIYRYENDQFLMPVRDTSSRFALEGMAQATMSGVLDSSFTRIVSQSARRYLDWVRGAVHRDEAVCFWVPNFTRPFARDEEKIQATATVWLTLESMAEAWPEFTDEIAGLRSPTVRFVETVWKPDPERFARIAFRVPTWNGPTDTRVPWEWPIDPLVVSALLTAERRGSRLSHSTHSQIGQAIADFLATETHGHWDDFLMKREGKNRAIPPNTLHYHRALLDYLAWQAHLLGQLFMGSQTMRDAQPK